MREKGPGTGRTVLVGPTRYAELCPDGRRLLLDHGFTLIENPSLSPMTPAEIEPWLPTIDAAVVGVEEWREDVLAAAPRLRVLTRLGVGLDNIDLASARRHGIDVTNVPGGNANAVAELAIGLMLAVWRHIPRADSAIRAGHWDRYTGTEIAGKTIGLVGFGTIARTLAKRLAGFDVRILAFDPYGDPAAAAELGVELVTLAEIPALSDVVSVHAPSNPQTHHLVDAAFLAAMKSSAILVNTSRGALVDEAALDAALRSDAIAGAGLDVWEVEPVAQSNPLLASGNIVAMTHGGADTFEAYHTVGCTTAQAIVDVFLGRTPQNLRN